MIINTVSFHIIKQCNTKCKFCYTTFNDIKKSKQLSLQQVSTILYKLKKAGIKKITFAGGEPMLYKHLNDTIILAKTLGFTTSIITNGSFITREFLDKMTNYLDWIGLSVDSTNKQTNNKIGRTINFTKLNTLCFWMSLLVSWINLVW